MAGGRVVDEGSGGWGEGEGGGVFCVYPLFC